MTFTKNQTIKFGGDWFENQKMNTSALIMHLRNPFDRYWRSHLRFKDHFRGQNKMTVRRNSGSEEEYVVEIVFDKRLKNGKIDFLLKWKGYESEYLGAKKLIWYSSNRDKIRNEKTKYARRAQLKLVFREFALFSEICNDLLEKNPQGKK